jgi:hypothetical protein
MAAVLVLVTTWCVIREREIPGSCSRELFPRAQQCSNDRVLSDQGCISFNLDDNALTLYQVFDKVEPGACIAIERCTAHLWPLEERSWRQSDMYVFVLRIAAPSRQRQTPEVADAFVTCSSPWTQQFEHQPFEGSCIGHRKPCARAVVSISVQWCAIARDVIAPSSSTPLIPTPHDSKMMASGDSQEVGDSEMEAGGVTPRLSHKVTGPMLWPKDDPWIVTPESFIITPQIEPLARCGPTEGPKRRKKMIARKAGCETGDHVSSSPK